MIPSSLPALAAGRGTRGRPSSSSVLCDGSIGGPSSRSVARVCVSLGSPPRENDNQQPAVGLLKISRPKMRTGGCGALPQGWGVGHCYWPPQVHSRSSVQTMGRRGGSLLPLAAAGLALIVALAFAGRGGGGDEDRDGNSEEKSSPPEGGHLDTTGGDTKAPRARARPPSTPTTPRPRNLCCRSSRLGLMARKQFSWRSRWGNPPTVNDHLRSSSSTKVGGSRMSSEAKLHASASAHKSHAFQMTRSVTVSNWPKFR